MKINQTLINKAYGSNVGKVDQKKASNTNQTTTSLSSQKVDKVVMSQEALSAQVVSKASKAIVEELNVDYGNQKIGLLKEAIQNGSYKIDSEKIAQAMMNQVRFLGGSDE